MSAVCVQPSSVDIITASMGHSLASEGGFCCGGAHMVDHQVLPRHAAHSPSSLPAHSACLLTLPACVCVSA